MKKISLKFLKNIDEKQLEIIIAILLSIAALLMAWSTWVGGLHGSNQASNYAESNNLKSTANSEWSEASQYQMQDMILWNEIEDLQIEYDYYKDDDPEKEIVASKLYFKCYSNLTDEMAEQIGWDWDAAEKAESNPKPYIDEWLTHEEAVTTPFANEEFVDSYYKKAQEDLDKADNLLKKGNEDNGNADKYALVSVFLSLALFLFGIAGTFKNLPNRKIVVAIGVITMIIGVIYMIWVPLPRGFMFSTYFK